MAEKRYSAADQAKRVADKLGNLDAKGVVQVGTFTPVHPGGAAEAIKIMEQNQSAIKDQSQEQIGQGKEAMKQRAKESKMQMEQVKEKRKKG